MRNTYTKQFNKYLKQINKQDKQNEPPITYLPELYQRKIYILSKLDHLTSHHQNHFTAITQKIFNMAQVYSFYQFIKYKKAVLYHLAHECKIEYQRKQKLYKIHTGYKRILSKTLADKVKSGMYEYKSSIKNEVYLQQSKNRDQEGQIKNITNYIDKMQIESEQQQKGQWIDEVIRQIDYFKIDQQKIQNLEQNQLLTLHYDNACFDEDKKEQQQKDAFSVYFPKSSKCKGFPRCFQQIPQYEVQQNIRVPSNKYLQKIIEQNYAPEATKPVKCLTNLLNSNQSESNTIYKYNKNTQKISTIKKQQYNKLLQNKMLIYLLERAYQRYHGQWDLVAADLKINTNTRCNQQLSDFNLTAEKCQHLHFLFCTDKQNVRIYTGQPLHSTTSPNPIRTQSYNPQQPFKDIQLSYQAFKIKNDIRTYPFYIVLKDFLKELQETKKQISFFEEDKSCKKKDELVPENKIVFPIEVYSKLPKFEQKIFTSPIKSKKNLNQKNFRLLTIFKGKALNKKPIQQKIKQQYIPKQIDEQAKQIKGKKGSNKKKKKGQQ